MASPGCMSRQSAIPHGCKAGRPPEWFSCLTSSTLFMASHSSVYSIMGTLTRGSSALGRSTVIGLNLCAWAEEAMDNTTAAV